MIQEQLPSRRNATLDIVEPEPSDAPAIGSAKEGHGRLDFSDYVGHIDVVGGEFDLIVVDGRARAACLTAALRHLAATASSCSTTRCAAATARAIAAAPVVEQIHRGLTPTLPYPDQTSILTAR